MNDTASRTHTPVPACVTSSVLHPTLSSYPYVVQWNKKDLGVKSIFQCCTVCPFLWKSVIKGSFQEKTEVVPVVGRKICSNGALVKFCLFSPPSTMSMLLLHHGRIVRTTNHHQRFLSCQVQTLNGCLIHGHVRNTLELHTLNSSIGILFFTFVAK